MDSQGLAKHIAWLDAQATEQEALVQALEPYSDAMGTTTVSEIVARLRSIDPPRAESLLRWAQSLVAKESSLAVRATYTVMHKQNEAQQRTAALKRATWIARAKMVAGTQAFITGSHSADEDPAIADLRATAVATHLRSSLPLSRTVTVKPHVCSTVCEVRGDLIHLTRHVQVSIYTRAEMLQVGPMRHHARSMREAHRSYAALEAGQPQEQDAAATSRPHAERAALDAERAERRKEWASTLALWRELQPYRENFKYESIGTLVDHLQKDELGKACRIIEMLEAILADPMTPLAYRSTSRETLEFAPQTSRLEGGQETALSDLLAEMNEPNGETSVSVSGWHEKDESPALADRRARELFDHFKRRAHKNVRLMLRSHVCGPHCTREGLQVLRRIGWVELQGQPRQVLLEDIRIAVVGCPV